MLHTPPLIISFSECILKVYLIINMIGWGVIYFWSILIWLLKKSFLLQRILKHRGKCNIISTNFFIIRKEILCMILAIILVTMEIFVEFGRWLFECDFRHLPSQKPTILLRNHLLWFVLISMRLESDDIILYVNDCFWGRLSIHFLQRKIIHLKFQYYLFM